MRTKVHLYFKEVYEMEKIKEALWKNYEEVNELLERNRRFI